MNIIILLLLLLVPVCQAQEDEYTTTESGLKYLDIQEGIGRTPVKGQRLVVHYTGYFTDGRAFDSSSEEKPFEFVLGSGQVIKGWEEGLATMKAGGRRRLIVPPHLAYGSRGKGNIPPNTTLVFEVELLSIRNEKTRRIPE